MQYTSGWSQAGNAGVDLVWTFEIPELVSMTPGTLWYYCHYHSDMGGQVEVSSEPVPTFALTNNGTVNEGQDLIFTLTTTNIPNGTEVAFTTGGDSTVNVDYTDNLPHKFVINNNTATWTVTTLIDNSFDGSTPEDLLVILNATDSLGNNTGGLISNGQIYDMDPEPAPTPTPSASGSPLTNTPNNNDRYQMTVTPASAEELASGQSPQYMQFAIQAINSYDPAPGTTVGYTITGDWSQGDIQVLGIELSDPNNISSPVPSAQPNSVLNPYTNIFKIGTEQGTGYKTAAIRVYGANDAIIESLEAVRVTLDEYDSTGNTTSVAGVWNTGHIIDNTD